MREIPSLQILCLRAVGPVSCSAEATFVPSNSDSGGGGTATSTATLKGASNKAAHSNSNKTPSPASRLLRSFHTNEFISRTPCIGPGSARRVNGNDVDMFHPLGAVVMATASTSSSADTSNNQQAPLVFVYGNAACDCLQSYIDSLVELGRMDDQRLGVHFFDEWKQNVLLATATDTADDTLSRKRRLDVATSSTALGSLSLYNCNVALETFDSMRETKIGPLLATLDFSGIRGLTNELLDIILPDCPNLQHLALKNCRRITNIHVVGKHQRHALTTLDIGGAYNLTTDHVLHIVPQLPHLTKLHASGLGWNDASLQDLVALRHGDWTHLSLSFSLTLTQAALRTNILPLGHTLTCLALAFCETVMDNAAMGLLGRNLPLVKALDVRGNPALTTLTGWYDGRVSADLPVQSLTVLGRYSGLTEASVEETRRVHVTETVGLIVVLDAGGMGAAILAECSENEHKNDDDE